MMMMSTCINTFWVTDGRDSKQACAGVCDHFLTLKVKLRSLLVTRLELLQPRLFKLHQEVWGAEATQ